MSFVTGDPGTVVGENLSGYMGGTRRVPATPLDGFAGQQRRDQARHGFYLTAEIATAITAD